MGRLYTLRYRKGNIGATAAFVEVTNPTGDPAKDHRIAEAIGQAYCNKEVNFRYITVQEGIVADESILDPGVLDKILNPPPKVRRPAPANVEDPGPARLPVEDDQPAEEPEADDDDEEIGDEDEVMNRVTPRKSRTPEPEPEVDEPEETEQEEAEEVAPVKAKKGKKGK